MTVGVGRGWRYSTIDSFGPEGCGGGGACLTFVMATEAATQPVGKLVDILSCADCRYLRSVFESRPTHREILGSCLRGYDSGVGNSPLILPAVSAARWVLGTRPRMTVGVGRVIDVSVSVVMAAEAATQTAGKSVDFISSADCR